VTIDPEAARSFVYGHGRVLERRVYSVLFETGDPANVVKALAAYQNADGGFGHGLEPDKRAPGSQALDVEIAFERLVSVQATAPAMVTAACDWLGTISDPSGAVPILMPDIADFPRAGHWTTTEYPPGLNPTCGIVAHANAMGVSHPWVERASEYCFAELEAGRVEAEGHELLGVTKFLASATDQHRADAGANAVQQALPAAAFFKLNAGSDAYGVTPLDFAPSPDALAASWFGADIIGPHLAVLEAGQLADGGWDIAWEPVSSATRSEWRTIKTIHALQTLRAYGRW